MGGISLSLAELAEKLGAELHGDPDCRVSSVATLANAGPGQVAFLANPRYRDALADSRASAILLSADDRDACPANALVLDNPYLGYARTAALLAPVEPFAAGIDAGAHVADSAEIDATAWVGPAAVIEDDACIAAGVYVGPGCVVGRAATIGENSRLTANVTICHEVRIGRRVVVHPGTVIGGDGFGIANDHGQWVKVPQLGTVVVGDDVEIGANVTIDRGALENTEIGNGVKIDNLVQVGHNTIIGEHSALAGCVGISGSVKIGKRVIFAGGSGSVGHIEIADDVQVSGMTMVTKTITEPGIYSSGLPADPHARYRRNLVWFRKLDTMMRRLIRLEKSVKKNIEDSAQ